MPTQILSVSLRAFLMGQEVINRFDFVDTSGAADPHAVLAPFVTDVVTPYAAMAVSAMTFNDLLWRVVTDPLQAQQSYPISPAVAGADTQTPLPSYVAATVRWTFGPTVILSGESPQRRIRRGGKRLAGLGESRVAGNALQTASRAAVEAIVEGYLGMSVGGWIPCIAGLPKQPKPRPKPTNPALEVPNKYALITGFILNTYVGTQVSRKQGHGA